MQLTLTELYEAIQDIKIKNLEMYNLKSKLYDIKKSDIKEIEDKTFIDLKDLEPDFLKNSYYLATLLGSDLRLDNLNILKKIDFTPEVILSCISDTRCDFLRNLPDELKNKELLDILLLRTINYPITNIFKKSTYFNELNLKNDDKNRDIKKLLRQHEKNILNISDEFLTDNEIYEYLIRFHKSEDVQTSHIFQLRNVDWWIENTDIYKLLIQSMYKSSYNNKITFNDFDEKNSAHELVALMFASISPSFTEKYFTKFGFDMSNIEKYISISAESKGQYNQIQTWSLYNYLKSDSQLQQNLAIDFLKSNLNEVYQLKDHTDKEFQEFKEKFQASIVNVDNILSNFLKPDEKNKHDFYNLQKGNIYALILFFVNPSKYTEDEKEMEKNFKNLDRCLSSFANEREALLNIFSYNGDGQRTTGAYPFTLTPYFSKKWEIDIKDLRKLTADDFYNMWTSFSLEFEMKKDLLEQKLSQIENKSSIAKVRKF